LETIATYLYAAATLGRRTAEMHLAMAADPGEPAFAPEPLTGADMDSLRKEIDHQRQLAFSALSENLDRLPSAIAPEAQRLLTDGPALLDHLAARWTGVPQATKTRIHGDYHLGQVLWVDSYYVILDFEGEPTRSVDERREKFSPIRDVAGMLRSYHYSAYAGLFAFTQDGPDDFALLAPWAELWQQWVSAAFLRQYLATAGEASFMPRDNEEFRALLDGYMLAKALYELVYELNNRPDWVRIPLGGVLALLAAPAAAEQR
jgi:maltose alpha-D-glucosyltransferase/alpha-amylase